MFETWVFREQMYCNEVLVTLLGFWTHGEFVPFASPVVTPLITARRDASQQTMVLSSSQRKPLALGGHKIFNSLEFLRHCEKTNTTVLQGDDSA